MKVVIDTNALWGDLRLGSPEWRIIAAQHQRGHFELIFPEVIVRELVKQFREQFTQAADAARGAARKLKHLGQEVHVPLPDLREAVEGYEADLRQSLADSKIEITPIPDVSLSVFVDRSLAERRPFQSNSRGFRDAVIWESVKVYAESSEVVLVSGNGSDFAQSKAEPERLHGDLSHDIETRGLQTVTLVSSLKKLIDDVVPSAPDLALVRTRLEQDGEFRRALEDVVRDELGAFVWEKDDAVTIVDSDYGYVENVELLSVDGLDYVKIEDAHDVDDGTVLLDVVAAAWLTFSFTADQNLVEWLNEEGADIQIDVVEETWAQGSTMSRPSAVRFSIEYSLDDQDLGEIERGPATDAVVGDDRVLQIT